MGFVLSIFYFVTAYLTAPVIFGPLGEYRIQLVLAVLVLLASLSVFSKSFVLKTPQSLALLGLTFAMGMSVLVAERWASGAIRTFVGFIPSGLAYFLVCLHCNTKKRLQFLVFTMLFSCIFVIANGSIELLHGEQEVVHNQSTEDYAASSQIWQMEHPYLLGKPNNREEPNRLKGQGLLNDPNDFGQVVVCVIPLVFIFWRKRKMVGNLFFVVLPVCILIFGVYLTHSRGTLLALIAVLIMAGQRRIGKLGAAIVGIGAFAGAMALQFTGGRAISADSGADRTALWGESMALFKTHLIFGIGSGSLGDYLGMTAHNSVMVCAAELGLFGLFFWSMYLFSTLRDAAVVSSPAQVSEGVPIVQEEEGRYPQGMIRKVEEIDKADINNMGHLMVLSLTGFLVAGWFLSRAFVMTLFVLGGMVEVVYQMALQRGMVAPRLRLARLLPYTVGLAFILVLFMYITLRVVNLLH
jgi:hypothetical protein